MWTEVAIDEVWYSRGGMEVLELRELPSLEVSYRAWLHSAAAAPLAWLGGSLLPHGTCLAAVRTAKLQTSMGCLAYPCSPLLQELDITDYKIGTIAMSLPHMEVVAGVPFSRPTGCLVLCCVILLRGV